MKSKLAQDLDISSTSEQMNQPSSTKSSQLPIPQSKLSKDVQCLSNAAVGQMLKISVRDYSAKSRF